MSQDKIYIGKGVKKKDTWLKATISEKGIQLLKDNIQEFEGHRYAKININIITDPDKVKFGKDVEITLDTWTPDGTQSAQKTITPEDTDLGF